MIVMPGIKTIRWNEATMQTILAARQSLVDEGWSRPTIRETLYKLMKLPGWTKKHYDTLTVRLGKWRDEGLIEFGLWSDETGGNDYTPMTSRDITERIAELRDTVPAKLSKDGYLRFIFIEHEGMTYDIANMLDFSVAVVSSQGQLRREHFYTVVQQWIKVIKELDGKGVEGFALVDYDDGGRNIYNTHKAWLKRIFGIELKLYGVTAEQIRDAKLAIHESHQIDGWAATYGYERLKNDLLNLVGEKRGRSKPKRKKSR
jgi:hypothetical protein